MNIYGIKQLSDKPLAMQVPERRYTFGNFLDDLFFYGIAFIMLFLFFITR